MKRLTVLVFMCLLIFTTPSALQETSETPVRQYFDYSQFENRPGYTYDTSKNSWRYESKVLIDVTTSVLIIDWIVDGYSNNIFQGNPWVSITYWENEYWTVNEIQIILDDKLYSFKKLTDMAPVYNEKFSVFLIGNIGWDMINSLATVHRAAIKIYYEGKSNFVDLTDYMEYFMTDTLAWADSMVKAEVAAYLFQETNLFIDEEYTATVQDAKSVLSEWYSEVNR